jgi:hypothetical protein
VSVAKANHSSLAPNRKSLASWTPFEKKNGLIAILSTIQFRRSELK